MSITLNNLFPSSQGLFSSARCHQNLRSCRTEIATNSYFTCSGVRRWRSIQSRDISTPPTKDSVSSKVPTQRYGFSLSVSVWDPNQRCCKVSSNIKSKEADCAENNIRPGFSSIFLHPCWKAISSSEHVAMYFCMLTSCPSPSEPFSTLILRMPPPPPRIHQSTRDPMRVWKAYKIGPSPEAHL